MEATSNYSLADIAAAAGKNGTGEGGWAWLFLIIVLLAVGGGAWGGNRGPAPMPVNVATQSDVQTAINNQTLNAGIQQGLLSSANNNYETAQLVNGQTNTLMQQNYANQINAVQGFNNISTQIMNQTNTLASKIDQLGYQQERCCCEVKTQMLQDRLDDRNRQLLEAQNRANLLQQSQYILGNMGRWVGWEGSGSATSSSLAS